MHKQTDIIGDLAFGEPSYCLQNAHRHWWLQAVFDIFKAGTMIRAARRFPEPLATLLCFFIPRRLIRTRKEQFAFGVERVDKRLQQTTDRPDFSKALSPPFPPTFKSDLNSALARSNPC
jgi:aspirochlorine biosynthesis cytochrome P450 monooxygenase